MKTNAKSSIVALALLATLGLGASGAAHAGYAYDDPDVFWSIAVSQPGIHVGVSNAPPAPIHVHAPPPVYMPPPRVVYLPPPPPVYRVHPGYYGHGYGRGWGERRERFEHRGYERRGDEGRRHEGRGYEDHDRGHGGRSPDMNIGRR